MVLCSKHFTPHFEIAQRNFDFWEVVQSTQWFEQILPHKPRNSTMLCFNTFQTKIHSALLKVFNSTFGNSPKKFWFRKVVQSTQWLPQKPRNSTMLCFYMFQTKIHSALLKVFHSVYGNSPKKFWFQKVVQSTQWLEKILHHKPRNSTMCSLNMFQVNIHSALLKVFHSAFENSPKKIDFEK